MNVTAGTSIKFYSFPRTKSPPDFVNKIVAVFIQLEASISTSTLSKTLTSDTALATLRTPLLEMGFQLEQGKERESRIIRPVFFGLNGHPEKTYSVDAYHPKWKCGMETEAGRAVGGNSIYRDLIQALVMVEVEHLVLAVPNAYKYGKKNTVTDDFKHTIGVANALFGHTRIAMPYGLTVIGY
jgi:hypothetical protein